MLYAIVGNGVAGVTAARAIKQADASADVHLLSAEPYPYYRRPQLWEFIAGKIEQDALFFKPAEWYAEQGIQLHLGVKATALDPGAHRLDLSDGAKIEYDRLLLATGGRSFVPPCQGTDKEGVFTLRSLQDALAIKAFAEKVSQAVVIGGGLLGLETARALQSAGLDVTVIEYFSYLLPRQLDQPGAQVLQSLLEAQGLHILTSGATKEVLGNGHAQGVRVADPHLPSRAVPGAGQADEVHIPGELVIFSTGIRSRIALAEQAGIQVGRGVIVDEQLRTSAEDVFAAGDAAEFEGQVYGIIPAAIEQAQAAAANMVTPGSQVYTGTVPATTLKVAGAQLTSMGEATLSEDECTPIRHVDMENGVYYKCALRDGRIVGAILLNAPGRVRAFARLIKEGVDVSAYVDQLFDDDFSLL